MDEKLPGHLLPLDEHTELLIEISRDGGEFADDYTASTPPWLAPEQRIAKHSPL